ncbi:MAG: hypothetical protein ACRDRH_14355 [Pseudonocardia sp.]
MTLLGWRSGPPRRSPERRDRRRSGRAAPARPVRGAGPELRPESEWEYISYPGGVYPARRLPVAELIVGEEPAVIVLFTHDPLLAARVAWPLWSDEQDGGLTRPIRHWWRREPVDPAIADRDGYDDMWWPARPGTPGAIPLVEFPLPFRR